MLSGRPNIAGVIGWPVAHSLSPKLHNYWLEHYGIDGAYIPLAVKPEDLHDVLRLLPKMGFRGANLTLPHKEAALTYLGEHCDEAARRIGAVNTLVIGEDGSLQGRNSDAYGFAENIRPHLQGKRKAVVLGAGGAARAVCFALKQEGFSQIAVVNRTSERAQQLARDFSAKAVSWEERSPILHDADLLVNTTSLGMQGKMPLEIDLSALPKPALVTDIVYTPLLTPLLEQASARGNPVVDGLGMLMHQAVPGFEAWFGVTPEVTGELRDYLIS